MLFQRRQLLMITLDCPYIDVGFLFLFIAYTYKSKVKMNDINQVLKNIFVCNEKY